MSGADYEAAAEAILAWSGYGSEAYPRRDEARVKDRFGQHRVPELMKLIRAFEEDFYKSTASDVADDLAEMEKLAISDFEKIHPRFPSRATRALAWCYTFDFK